MKRALTSIAALMALVAITSCDHSPTAPAGEVIILSAQLLPSNEVPPVVNAEANGSGTATFFVRPTRDGSGAITSATIDVSVTLIGYPSGTTLTVADFHRGALGQDGAVILDTGLAPREVVLQNGTGAFTKVGIGIVPALAQEFLDKPGEFFFNVHTVSNLSGAGRGQLIK